MSKNKRNNLPWPFNMALEHGDNIDYKVGNWSKESDHDYVKKLGYTPEMGGDSSYFARGLRGFSLSSYGDWGSYFPAVADEKDRDIFLDMYDRGIIKMWRITAYIEVGKNEQRFTYSTNTGWRTYDELQEKWVDYNGDPYVKFSSLSLKAKGILIKLRDEKEHKEEIKHYDTPHKEFFNWIYDRLVYVHGENPDSDYMQSLRERIDDLFSDEKVVEE